MGGLTAALELSAKGYQVTLLERQSAPGGKMRQVDVSGRKIDAGPTVFTMRWVFEELFENIGQSLEDHIPLIPAEMLARHAWTTGDRLDLFVDQERSADAVGAFAGAAEARRYKGFCKASAEMFQTLEHPFIRTPAPSMKSLMKSARSPADLTRLGRTRPFSVMWKALADHFQDPRLRQLYGRYTTYCGSSPFDAPATLMLVAHVEQAGVWYIKGGMHQLAVGLANLARQLGVDIQYDTEVAEIRSGRGGVESVIDANGVEYPANAVVVNADCSAVGTGVLGRDVTRAVPATKPRERSLSAITWLSVSKTSGFPLVRHNVFFSEDYQREFDLIFKHRKVPDQPTTYICAQDRGDRADDFDGGEERLLCLINAPAVGDSHEFTDAEIARHLENTTTLLQRCGLQVELASDTTKVATPNDFADLFPASGGALYGRANHGWQASFQRPGCRTRIPGLYLAGGSIHPGPGVPMAALSGRMAAESLDKDLSSPRMSRRMATSGGI